jgi:hypothetical protein
VGGGSGGESAPYCSVCLRFRSCCSAVRSRSNLRAGRSALLASRESSTGTHWRAHSEPERAQCLECAHALLAKPRGGGCSGGSRTCSAVRFTVLLTSAAARSQYVSGRAGEAVGACVRAGTAWDHAGNLFLPLTMSLRLRCFWGWGHLYIA